MTVTVLIRRTLCRLSQPFLCWGPSELRGQGVGDHVKNLFLSCEFYVARSRDGAASPITWLEGFPLAPKKASAILMKILKEAAFQTKHLHQRRTWPTPWNHSLKGQRGTGYSVISSRWAKGNLDAIPLSQIRILWRGVNFRCPFDDKMSTAKPLAVGKIPKFYVLFFHHRLIDAWTPGLVWLFNRYIKELHHRYLFLEPCWVISGTISASPAELLILHNQTLPSWDLTWLNRGFQDILTPHYPLHTAECIVQAGTT